MSGPGLPTNRSPANSPTEHAADHNVVAPLLNLFDKDSLSPSTGQVLTFNGSLYAPATPAGGGFSSTALDASLGGSDGTASSQTIGATTFTTINLPTENVDAGNNFASNLYTCPSTGLYLCIGKVRIKDETTSAAMQFGVGVHTSNGDDPSFKWMALPVTSGATASRLTLDYQRLAQFNAADQLRLYGWASSSLIISTANLSILRVA